MNIFSRLFPSRKPTTLTDTECLNILIEEGRKSTYGWNAADAAKLEALWSSDRFPKPSATFTPNLTWPIGGGVSDFGSSK